MMLKKNKRTSKRERKLSMKIEKKETKESITRQSSTTQFTVNDILKKIKQKSLETKLNKNTTQQLMDNSQKNEDNPDKDKIIKEKLESTLNSQSEKQAIINFIKSLSFKNLNIESLKNYCSQNNFCVSDLDVSQEELENISLSDLIDELNINDDLIKYLYSICQKNKTLKDFLNNLEYNVFSIDLFKALEANDFDRIFTNVLKDNKENLILRIKSILIIFKKNFSKGLDNEFIVPVILYYLSCIEKLFKKFINKDEIINKKKKKYKLKFIENDNFCLKNLMLMQILETKFPFIIYLGKVKKSYIKCYLYINSRIPMKKRKHEYLRILIKKIIINKLKILQNDSQLDLSQSNQESNNSSYGRMKNEIISKEDITMSNQIINTEQNISMSDPIINTEQNITTSKPKINTQQKGITKKPITKTRNNNKKTITQKRKNNKQPTIETKGSISKNNPIIVERNIRKRI